MLHFGMWLVLRQLANRPPAKATSAPSTDRQMNRLAPMVVAVLVLSSGALRGQSVEAFRLAVTGIANEEAVFGDGLVTVAAQVFAVGDEPPVRFLAITVTNGGLVGSARIPEAMVGGFLAAIDTLMGTSLSVTTAPEAVVSLTGPEGLRLERSIRDRGGPRYYVAAGEPGRRGTTSMNEKAFGELVERIKSAALRLPNLAIDGHR